eukprot:CAMPEP_0115374832 /NCGR_PEP_ID=MMETSP0271-20121206/2152_1 /TAXON_ID=71861 /ORGANISM="Scrippsiella trochoidea, Strain CCMP3099" /LENGTH=187 /DNA_ID=CAMNT_0002797881 /DNA_START=719 /DNA_END=1280 /DNA_ORIENTATION=-
MPARPARSWCHEARMVRALWQHRVALIARILLVVALWLRTTACLRANAHPVEAILPIRIRAHFRQSGEAAVVYDLDAPAHVAGFVVICEDVHFGMAFPPVARSIACPGVQPSMLGCRRRIAGAATEAAEVLAMVAAAVAMAESGRPNEEAGPAASAMSGASGNTESVEAAIPGIIDEASSGESEEVD